MGGIYRVFVEIKVNKKKSGLTAEPLEVKFCHNWSGDAWFVRIVFRDKETSRIYVDGDYARYSVYEELVRKFVEEFVIKERRATFKQIDEIVREICGKRPIWHKIVDD